ncbi:MAG: GAF domain-containing protein [Verrucomicrobiaceae bacterium]|nr:MAG: GAF domain-containing protein [Verrucomicrobiaceae bacterium]
MADGTKALRKSLQVYKGLVEVSAAINSITDYGELLREILNVARRVFLAEAASLFLMDAESGNLELSIATRGESGYVEPKLTVPRGKGIAGWVLEHGKPLVIPDAYKDERFFKEADRLTGFTTRSILCAPLKRDSQMIGVLQILNPREKKSFDEDDLEGFCAYVNLTAIAIEKLRAVERMRAQERIDRDIAIAAEIQRELLSRAIPARVGGAHFSAHNTPATNVGGDFYGVFPGGNGEIYFAVGDVSGKGISAALLMAQTLSAMHFVFGSATTPSKALALLNETLHANIIRGMFITTLVGKMNPAKRRVELASAGHCLPLLVKADGSVSKLATPGAMPIGILPKVHYDHGEVVLDQGDRLVLYTDGLSESRRQGTDILFDESLPQAASGPAVSPDELLNRIVLAERRHRGTGPQLDDLTILVGGFE